MTGRDPRAVSPRQPMLRRDERYWVLPSKNEVNNRRYGSTS